MAGFAVVTLGLAVLIFAEKSPDRSTQGQARFSLAIHLKRTAAAAKRLAEYNSMLKQLKSMIDSGKLKVRIVRNKMVI